MTAERWEQIEHLYHSALDLEADKRTSYLEQACAGDADLRREVESLLSNAAASDGALEGAALEHVARDYASASGPDLLGKTLGRYEVTACLGAGGMGKVYRARDLRLNREVALKVLPRETVAPGEHRRRFEREARAASALNHPNIVTVYDIDTADCIDFIAMEYVPGKTVAELIGRKRLRLKNCLGYAVQMADALAAAHAAGITHRDLKPSNVIVGNDGRVRILDFGLAKALEKPGMPDGSHTRIETTAPGMILGTAAYMSPEQAEGKPTDARSDVFSFGSMLYEMITGRKAFEGETIASTLAAVLRAEPKPVSQVMHETPPEVERIINRCLRKDPNRRYQHVDDLKVALEELIEDSESGRTAPIATRPKNRFLELKIGVGVVALAAALGAGWWLGRPKERVEPALTRLTSGAGLPTNPAISPDGKLVAYALDRGGTGVMNIFVRQIEDPNVLQVTHDPAGASEPSFSPDSTKIVFRSEREGGGIYWVSALGGTEHFLAKHGHYPHFSPGGASVAVTCHDDLFCDVEGINIISFRDGAQKTIARDLDNVIWPVWSSDGRHVLVFGSKGRMMHAFMHGLFDWWLVPVDGGPARKTGAFDALDKQHIVVWSHATAWIGDQVFFQAARHGQSRSLWQATLSPKTGKFTGAAEHLWFGTEDQFDPSFSTGSTGPLRAVFATRTAREFLWSMPADTNRGKALGEARRITDDETGWVSICADRRKMVYNSSGECRLRDLETGADTPLPYCGCITADGSRIIYKDHGVNRIPIAGGEPEKLCERDFWSPPVSLSPDGRYVLLVDSLPGKESFFTVFLLNTETRKVSQLLSHPDWSLWQPHFSPDGHWISFHASVGRGNRASSVRSYVAPFRPDGIPENDWTPVGDGPAEESSWSEDGSLLYFHTRRDGFMCIWAQHLNPATKRPDGPPFPVFHAHSARRVILDGEPPAVARGRIVFTQRELSGDIWMTEWPRRK